ncbi:hypothetical protein N7493_010048 [Penicillium malachiteum]|uniref:Uncharacterized protein n=1 Tax=Penicillium malachiteum TaxID=1324776 RepID=A0AAD6HE21_9EURO|nr:hypothetical protein N7493_010048 [Penicillium malachiteum]
MSALYEFVSENYQVWDSCELLATDSIHITEIWMHHASQKMITSHRRVSNNHIDAWLNQTSEGSNEESTSLLRLVWVEFQHMEKVQHISPTILDALLINFHIELAYKWNWTCYAGSTKFSNTHSSNRSLFSYSVCNHPKFATAWSYDVSTGLTQGIYFAPSSQIPELQNLVQSLEDIAGHPMLPALVFGISLSGLVNQNHETTKENVRTVEVRTKFHSWTSRNEAPAEGDYLSLSAMTAGAKTKIANLCRKTKVLLDLCDFVEGNLHPVGVDEKIPYSFSLWGSTTDIVSLADEYTRVLRKRTMLQEADVKFFQHRADIQIQSVCIRCMPISLY